MKPHQKGNHLWWYIIALVTIAVLLLSACGSTQPGPPPQPDTVLCLAACTRDAACSWDAPPVKGCHVACVHATAYYTNVGCGYEAHAALDCNGVAPCATGTTPCPLRTAELHRCLANSGGP